MVDFSESIQDLLKAGEERGNAKLPPGGNVPYAVVPVGHELKLLESFVFNDHRTTPERVKAKVTVTDAESFIHYFQLFADPNSRIFADEQQLKVVAIMDYHASGEGTPRWCQHSVTLQLRQSEEWKRWLAYNNKQLTQQQFSEFLEQNSIDITTPTPAAMMEVARDLNATTEVDFGAGLRMNDGQVRFRYTETTKSSVGAGTLAVPEQFTINIPIFIGGDRMQMQALLRFRVKEGHLCFWYTLVRPEEIQRDAFLVSREAIATKLAMIVINGAA